MTTLESGVPDSLTAEEASAVLGVTRTALRLWAKRFGFPRPASGGAPTPVYAAADIEALAEALPSSFSIPSAVLKAKELGPVATSS